MTPEEKKEYELETEPLIEIRLSHGKGYLDFILIKDDQQLHTIRILTTEVTNANPPVRSR